MRTTPLSRWLLAGAFALLLTVLAAFWWEHPGHVIPFAALALVALGLFVLAFWGGPPPGAGRKGKPPREGTWPRLHR